MCSVSLPVTTLLLTLIWPIHVLLLCIGSKGRGRLRPLRFHKVIWVTYIVDKPMDPTFHVLKRRTSKHQFDASSFGLLAVCTLTLHLFLSTKLAQSI